MKTYEQVFDLFAEYALLVDSVTLRGLKAALGTVDGSKLWMKLEADFNGCIECAMNHLSREERHAIYEGIAFEFKMRETDAEN